MKWLNRNGEHIVDTLLLVSLQLLISGYIKPVSLTQTILFMIVIYPILLWSSYTIVITIKKMI